MIVNSDTIKDFSDTIFGNLTTLLIYQGPVPSVGVYIAGFLSDFSWSGSKLLQGYTNIDTNIVKTSQGYRLYKINNDYSLFSKQSGTASWAVLFDKSLTNDLLVFNSLAKTISFNRDINANDSFMIVPVTEANVNGVIRFSSIEFSHPADENIQDLEIDFSNL